MSEERLTQDELALVLRRASELDAVEQPGRDDAISVAAIEAAAQEAGLAPAYVRRAVAELRAGVLGAGEAKPPGRAVRVVRLVPGPVDGVAASVDRFLSGQLLVKTRDRDGVQLWRPRTDLGAQVVRGLGRRSRFRLTPLSDVAVRLVACDDGTLVGVEGRLRRGLQLTPRLVGGGLAAAGLVGGGVTLALGLEPIALGSVAGGAATGAGGYTISRGVAHRGARQAHESLAGFLDRLEQGEDPRRFHRRRRRSGSPG